MNLSPSIFVSHGAPTLLIDPVPTRPFLTRLGKQIGRPRGILCVSAHWETAVPMVSGSSNPETIYDFYGFPPELYKTVYLAPGGPDLATKVVELVQKVDLKTELDPRRGLDHGAWVPLKLMYPKADIPVVQLSVQSYLGTKHHYQLGRALRLLRKEGVLILASGGATHNLRDFAGKKIDSQPVQYAREFDEWLATSVVESRNRALLNYLDEGPQARRNHPTPEHFLPLLVALGAASEETKGRMLHTGFTYGVLSMAAFGWQ